MTEDSSYDSQLDPEKIPRHVAVIMDGNGRWARARGWIRTRGHEEGAESVRAVTRMCGRLGIEVLTIYAFSTENWKRPAREVNFLMRLLTRFLRSERDEIMKKDVCVRAIGRIEELPDDTQEELRNTVRMSADNSGLILRLALNYGGRQEIVDAARGMLQAARDGEFDPADLNPDTFRRFFYEPDMSDPDLLVRTGGEMRLSNFLLWEMSYAELYVTSVCWPAFREAELAEAFAAYARRERRFGGLDSGQKPTPRRTPSSVS